jgi:hypothetical protein
MGVSFNFAADVDNDAAIYIDASDEQTGSISINNPSDTDVEIYFTVASKGTTTNTANASRVGDVVTLWGGVLSSGGNVDYEFDLANAVTRTWVADQAACDALGGELVGTSHCITDKGFDVSQVSGIEWSINSAASAETSWANGPLDGKTIVFDNLVIGACTESDNTSPTITTVTATPNPVAVGEEVSISVDATDADGTVDAYVIEVDGETFTTSTATWTPTAAGTFTISVTVTDNEGATASTTQDVEVTEEEEPIDNGVITVNSPSDGESINNPGLITFDIDVTAAVTKVNYVITNPDGSKSIFTDEEGPDFNFEWRPKGTDGADQGNIGNNTIKIMAYGSDGDLLEFKEVKLTLTGTPDFSETGINEAVYISELTIYPMPASSNATVSLTARTAGSVSVEVLDMNGHVVLVENGYISSNDLYEVNFSVENLAAGIYLTRVTLNGETVTKKLVVQ